jgi:putative ABC transport system permease protein
MLKNYFLITLRSMLKSKLYISINIIGMAVAIACCIVAYYNYEFNASFDDHHTSAGDVYRVNSIRQFQGTSTAYGFVPVPLGEMIRQNVKEIDALTRYSPSGANIKIDDDIFDARLSYVDPDFFRFFTFSFINGDPSSITRKSNLMISDKLAERLFGKEEAVGKEISQVMADETVRDYTIAAVFKTPPPNSSFHDEAYALYDNYLDTDTVLHQGTNWYYRNTLFVRMANRNAKSNIETQLASYAPNNNKVREDFILTGFVLDPFKGMAVRDTYSEIPGTWTRDASPLAAVIGTAVMAIFVLLIACFNLTNTSIAISSRRLKEIGIRKVMGSLRSQLIFQFIGETMLVCFFALILAVGIAEFFLIPAFNSLWPFLELSTDYFGKPDFTLVMIGVLLFTGLVAGSYPAFYISRFQPTSILKGKLKLGGTNYFTRFLLTMQFAISLCGIVSSFAFIDNARYQKEFDLGFNQKGVIYTRVNSESQFNLLRDAMAQNPDVISIAGSEHHIFSGYYNDPIKHDGTEIETDIMNIGDNYLATVGFRLVEGRDFIRDSQTDRKESVIVSEKLAAKFGWDKPVGKEITWMDTARFYVVGVFKDVYTNGLWREMEPMMLRYAPNKNYRHVIVSASADNIVKVNEYMEEKWKELFPNRKFFSRYMDSAMVEASRVNNNILKMFIFLGIVAVALSVTGLFTLVSLNIIKKMKEIGVRKVLGASTGNISRVINTEFAIILGVACFLGAYLGMWMSGLLMDNIWDFYQKATVETMVASCALLIVASILTVAFKTYNTARMNPVNVLRDE